MITGELRNKIDSIWEIFWTGGLANPLDVIEQITYLMFIHDLDDIDNKHSKENNMLGIEHNSIFEGEYTIGKDKVSEMQFKWTIPHTSAYYPYDG